MRLVDFIDGTQSSIMSRSIFKLVEFYNILPQHVVNVKNPRHLQGYLQAEAMKRCKNGIELDELVALTWL